MGKIAGIKDKSLETYPDKSGQPTISTYGKENSDPVLLVVTTPTSLLTGAAPVEAGGSGDRIIVMFSGVLQWPASGSGEGQSPENATITVGIYLDGSPAYSIQAFVPASNLFPNIPPAPVPFSLFWETPVDGVHAVDVKAFVNSGGLAAAAYAAQGSLVLITTPV